MTCIAQFVTEKKFTADNCPRALSLRLTNHYSLITIDFPESGDASPRMSEKSVDLPGAVRSDEPDAMAAVYLERDILEENAPGERFADLRNGEHRVDGHCSCERMDRKCESVAARPQFDHA